LVDDRSYTVLCTTALLNNIQKKNTASWREWNKNMNYIKLAQYCAGDKIEKNEVGWACGAYG